MANETLAKTLSVLRWIWDRAGTALVVVLVIVTFIFGYALGRGPAETTDGTQQVVHDHDAPKKAASVWTCSMDPQIRKKSPGKCPICGMKLIQAAGGGAGAGQGTGPVFGGTFVPRGLAHGAKRVRAER